MKLLKVAISAAATAAGKASQGGSASYGYSFGRAAGAI